MSRTQWRGGGGLDELEQHVGDAVDEDTVAEPPNSKIVCDKVFIEASGGAWKKYNLDSKRG